MSGVIISIDSIDIFVWTISKLMVSIRTAILETSNVQYGHLILVLKSVCFLVAAHSLHAAYSSLLVYILLNMLLSRV